MAFMRTLLGGASRSRGMATATGAKMKAYAAPASESDGGAWKKKAWGDYVPVYVAVGMIALSAGLGIHLVKQQLMHAPGVTLKKSKRRTLPELTDPDGAVEEADKFIKKSFFRKVAHVQELETPVPDTIRGDVFTKKPKAETLKDVGVDPNPNLKPRSST